MNYGQVISMFVMFEIGLMKGIDRRVEKIVWIYVNLGKY